MCTPPGPGSLIVDMTPFSPRCPDVQSNLASNLAEQEKGAVHRKAKRVRLLLDSRIELTDEELKVGLFPTSRIRT